MKAFSVKTKQKVRAVAMLSGEEVAHQQNDLVGESQFHQRDLFPFTKIPGF